MATARKNQPANKNTKTEVNLGGFEGKTENKSGEISQKPEANLEESSAKKSPTVEVEAPKAKSEKTSKIKALTEIKSWYGNRQFNLAKNSESEVPASFAQMLAKAGKAIVK